MFLLKKVNEYNIDFDLRLDNTNSNLIRCYIIIREG